MLYENFRIQPLKETNLGMAVVLFDSRTNLKQITILYQGPKIWNSLPVTITSLSSFPNFKKKRARVFSKIITE